jgi:hypothetical protein
LSIAWRKRHKPRGGVVGRFLLLQIDGHVVIEGRHERVHGAREDGQDDVEGLAILFAHLARVEIAVELDALKARLLEAIDVGDDAHAPLQYVIGKRGVAPCL